MKAFSEFVRELAEKGYIVKFDTRAMGRSGTSHRISMLAEADKGGSPEKKRVICLEKSVKRETDALDMIRVFAVAYDLDAKACYILNGAANSEASGLAKYYGITFVSPDG